ncbi:hypothetical protein TruAng_000077 [Truncatella angustata]|nr:hypothetical protein TruAng_000077 [Truncatella angustata]
MRLLNTHNLTLREFHSTRPEYAILSHTWGDQEDEFSFQELQSGEERHREKKGFDKIARFCHIASTNGYDWVWVDTCCIDKSSSAELSEAINSMYRWYKESEVCYAYLEDIESGNDIGSSRWFTRGWTLQELLAPNVVEFYDWEWTEIGTKHDMRETISTITGIDANALRKSLVPSLYTVALRMSWAARRVTTREEDTAYCLLGIFEVHMPLLYGESEKAFQRLQEEILNLTEDYTILAWRNRPKAHGDMERDPTSVLAESPWDFRNDTINLKFTGFDFSQLRQIDWNPFQPREKDLTWPGCPTHVQFKSRPVDFEPPRKTARGLRVTLPFVIETSPSDYLIRGANLAFLYCFRRPKGEMVCLVLYEEDGIHSSSTKGQFYRPLGRSGIHFIAPRSVTLQFRTVYIRVIPRNLDPTPNWTQSAYQGLTRLILFGSIGKPQLFKLDRIKIILIHIRRGSVFIRLLSSLGVYGIWCRLSITTGGTFEDERNAIVNDRRSFLANEDLIMEPRLRSILTLDNGYIECKLKARPKRWLDNVTAMTSLREDFETLKLEQLYSLELRTSGPAADSPPELEILGIVWI